MAPVLSVMSAQVRLASSEIRSPVWYRQHEHRLVTSAGPSVFVAGFDQRIDFLIGEVGDEVALGSLWWDREHPSNRCRVLDAACSGCCNAA